MKKYQIKEYKALLYDDIEIRQLLEEYIIKCCLNIANNANFPTNYEDVKNHLFENDNYLKFFIVEESDKVIPDIKGFLICDQFNGYKGMNFLHCHGIILSPDIQGLGLSKKLINHAVALTRPDVVTAKTHNPRCFNAFINIDSVVSYYPNEYGDLPSEILDLVSTNHHINQSDDKLIYRNAYPDVKIQQPKRNDKLDIIFNQLSLYDAQTVVVILNDSKLHAKKRILKSGN
jgi:hypothetical protein